MKTTLVPQGWTSGRYWRQRRREPLEERVKLVFLFSSLVTFYLVEVIIVMSHCTVIMNILYVDSSRISCSTDEDTVFRSHHLESI